MGGTRQPHGEARSPHMLLIALALVAALWVAVVTVVIAVCVGAARSDRVLFAAARRERAHPAREALRLIA
ncbi:MAG: hypothetical protein JWR30_2175 [Conexibacter sp.]|jgi:hypothetical protein|nr:hypothetical protein [Conexibacter sp.]MCZ4491788.1 hypothetical protein [Conexibacter sp.]MDX6713597.1 hypothetical protein [Baekduia sp.]